jgi:SAM-dependent methyltransferase
MTNQSAKVRTKHLDLGCGAAPRNPYRQQELYGLDIREGLSAVNVVEVRAANLSLDPIPFADSTFDSLSAYDFLEHVPRVSIDYQERRTYFPFVNLMNEIWRVLKPQGVFYAVTPVYPHLHAFTDPTHVNPITRKTHRYFTGAEPLGRMYGFKGQFDLIRQCRVHPRGDYHPNPAGLKLRIKNSLDILGGSCSHMLWELRKI